MPTSFSNIYSIIIVKSFFYFGVLQLVNCSGVQNAPDAFPSDHAVAVHFIQPIFIDIVGDSGEVEKDGLDASAKVLFMMMDLDGSGGIQLHEYLRSIPLANIEEERYVFALMDSNRSGGVSVREYRIFLYKIVNTADTNQDGLVSDMEAEMSKYKSPKYF